MSELTAVSGLDDMRVLSLQQVADLAGISLATLRRQITAGTGPKMLRMSARRVGVRVGDYKRWLEERTE
ncbi:helix-turn-helix transcriptional regulator [Xanthobacter autotrophicus]|uniref:helix-turn-helix transcriptional regulator n=1 Tax=Xanthobacter autotrophicus TaxID=280 RepID=UPI0037263D45